MQPESNNMWRRLTALLKSTGGPWAALVVLLLICCISNEHFRSVQNLINITRQVSYSGLIALGMTFVIAGGGIDLSVGSLLAFSGVISILGMNAVPGSETLAVAVAAVIAVALGAACGAANGALVALGKVPPFIATLGTLVIFRSLALYFGNSGLVSLTVLFSEILKQTRLGRHICAVGSNERVARYAAIRTGLVKFYTYLIAGTTAGISALLFGGRLNSVSSTSAGQSYELDAIAAVIIGGSSMNGGKASIWGTLAGILILGIVSNVLDMWGISVTLQGTVKGLVIIIAVMIQRKTTA